MPVYPGAFGTSLNAAKGVVVTSPEHAVSERLFLRLLPRQKIRRRNCDSSHLPGKIARKPVLPTPTGANHPCKYGNPMLHKKSEASTSSKCKPHKRTRH